MNIVKPQTIAGVMELLPEDQLAFDYIKNIIEETFLSYQFLPIDTPAIEKNDILFAKGGGETEKQIFGIDSSKKDMSLRFDLTVPPVSLIPLPIFWFEFTKIIPAVPIIKAIIVFIEILSSGSRKSEIITIINEFDAWIIDDFTPLVFERPI